MGVKYGNDFQYANDKLSDSVVMLGSEPVYIVHVNNEGRTRFLYLAKENTENYCNLADLDLTPIKLGYMNNLNSKIFVSRRPVRVFKQGIREGTLTGIERGASKRISFDKYFVNMVKGVYPSIEECFESIHQEETVGRAFSKSFALTFNGKSERLILSYKEIPVGTVDKGMKHYLYDKFAFLNESLTELIK